MNYRSIADLATLIRNNSWRLPSDIDLIVGIPRSGMLAAHILGLQLNLGICDLGSFLANNPIRHGNTRKRKFDQIKLPQTAKKVLIVDDSCDSGQTLKIVREEIEKQESATEFIFLSCYVTKNSVRKVDYYFELLPQPRIFEWNLFHRPYLSSCCIDLDGVLGVDPTREENDDGVNYVEFLKTTKPLLIPSYPIGAIVTSRLEKYRHLTQDWLRNYNFDYVELHMLNLPDAETRIKLNNHADYKAKIYRKSVDKLLFIESDRLQAIKIARLSGKPVLCFSTQELFYYPFTIKTIMYKSKILAKKLLRGISEFKLNFLKRM